MAGRSHLVALIHSDFFFHMSEAVGLLWGPVPPPLIDLPVIT